MTLRDPVAQLAAELSPREHSRRLALYVALGDSFTAGAGADDGEAWPELLTERLEAEHPTIALRNLAVDGATSVEVLEQLPEAVELEPDLVTLVCGANDVLRCTRPDAERYAANLALILGRLRVAHPEVRIATATSPESWDFMPMGPRTRRRVERGISELQQRHPPAGRSDERSLPGGRGASRAVATQATSATTGCTPRRAVTHTRRRASRPCCATATESTRARDEE